MSLENGASLPLREHRNRIILFRKPISVIAKNKGAAMKAIINQLTRIPIGIETTHVFNLNFPILIHGPIRRLDHRHDAAQSRNPIRSASRCAVNII